MNKKHICLFLAIFFLILNTIPYIGVFADNDIVIYEPDANTDITETLDYDPTDLGALQIIYGILKNGSSVDFSNTSLSTSNNPWNDFISYLSASVIGVDPEIWDDAIDASLESLATTGVILNGTLSLFDGFGAFGIDYLTGLAQYYNLGFSDSDSDIPNPQPNPDFSFINNINNLFYPNSANRTSVDFFTSNTIKRNDTGDIIVQGFNPKNYTYQGNFIYNNYNNHLDTIGNTQSLDVTLVSPIVTININSSDPSNVLVNYSSSAIVELYPNYPSYSFFNWNSGSNAYIYMNNPITSYQFNQTVFSGLSVAINYIYQHYSNVNLFVDGVCWAYVGNSEQHNISIGGNTYINNIPAPIQYIVPDNSYLDLNALKQKILDAIMGAGLLQWVDIADCIVDVNGNQVIYTYNVIRNDYDILYREQYPETLIPDNGNYFNKNLLVNYRNELQTPVLVVDNTLDILPSDLKTCLYICGILAIFALVINRLLE